MEPKQTAETIPSWDGNPRGWRRYQREVAWYVLGTKKNQRALIGPRLVSKLTGPARLLAMSWNRTDIAGSNGVQSMMKKLEASPLVRRKLHNTAAVMQQYFTYKRIQGESVSAYLVRETLFFEEFLESLMDLKDGPSMDFIFDELDPNTDEEDDDDGGASSNAGSKKKESPKGYEKIPQRDPDGGDPDEPGSRAASRAAPRGGPTSLSTTDSFILTQLRGWRLLSGASLNAEEWRSILASTKNQLDYDSVSSALMILFDEQAQHHRHAQAHGPVYSLHHVEEDDWGWQDDSSWDWSDPWANMAWESGDWYY